ncbi:MAG: sugar transferase [Anaerolineales bacterium]|jgi:exopolysaccharide biosynthesis polyprenyl glycosylphosphotransferase|nr:sugar transferase [Anaerolineales bacterium]
MASENLKQPLLRLRPGEQKVVIFAGDLLVAVVAFLGGVYFWAIADPFLDFSFEFFQRRVQGWYYLLPVIWLVMMVELYDLHRAANWRKTLRGLMVVAGIGLVAYALIFFTTEEPNSLPRRGVAAFLVLAFLLTLLWRSIYIRFYTTQGLMGRVLIVGAGENGRSMAHIFSEISPAPFNLIGFIDDDPQKIGTSLEGYRVFAGSERMLELVEALSISDIIVAITGEMRGQTFQVLLDAQERGVEITRMRTIYEELLGRVPIHHLESDWVIRSFVDEARASGFYQLASRALDILTALVGLLVFLVMLPFLSLAILFDDGWPIFYTQSRLGRGGQNFEMLKLRTMIKNAEADGKAQVAEEHDPRVTHVGNFLRRTRLDEFPQFWNILRGEMSMVGPRAERAELVIKYQKKIPFYRARLMVKPGLTGWAQVNYGYASTVEDTEIKLEYDLYYIKHRSIWMDVLIILRTITTVLARRGR